jgi:acetyl-CoA C-acetyltransferase
MDFYSKELFMSAYIYDGVRTPRGRGKSTGSLYTMRPIDLLADTLCSLQERNSLDTSCVDDVVVGCVTQSGEQGSSIARFAALLAGYDESVSGVTLNRFCGSGLEAVNHAAAMCASGYYQVVVAGGVESMSRVKMGSDGGAIWDTSTQWKVPFVPQGISADLLATKQQISRKELDLYALNSHKKAAWASEQKLFKKSINPVKDQNGKLLLDHDENVRPDCTIEQLNSLKASFEVLGEQYAFDALTKSRYPEVESIQHVHSAGNSSAIVDGACAVLVGSKEAAAILNQKPRAKIKAVAVTSSEPVIMLTGPVPATDQVLKKAGMTISDIDLFEVNEAFAAVPIYYQQHFDLNPEIINPLGGAIALGHPLGATGAMLITTMLDALEQRDLNTGLITLCIGGGMGIATIVERV